MTRFFQPITPRRTARGAPVVRGTGAPKSAQSVCQEGQPTVVTASRTSFLWSTSSRDERWPCPDQRASDCASSPLQTLEQFVERPDSADRQSSARLSSLLMKPRRRWTIPRIDDWGRARHEPIDRSASGHTVRWMPRLSRLQQMQSESSLQAHSRQSPVTGPHPLLRSCQVSRPPPCPQRAGPDTEKFCKFSSIFPLTLLSTTVSLHTWAAMLFGPGGETTSIALTEWMSF